MLTISDLHYAAGKKTILDSINLEFDAGKLHIIAGPNGCGKSTLLRLATGGISPTGGSITYNGRLVQNIARNELAKIRSILGQDHGLAFPMVVEEVVMMGRYPHFSLHPNANDYEITRKAMELSDVWQLRKREYATLSGGEKQRVMFARVTAQIWPEETTPRWLFLDEAVSHLDLRHQHALMEAARHFCSMNITVIAVLHDLNLSLKYADRLVLMKEGRVVADLPEPHRMTAELILEVFGVKAEVLRSGIQDQVFVLG